MENNEIDAKALSISQEKWMVLAQIRRLMAELYPAEGSWEPSQYRGTNGLLKRLNIHITYIKSRDSGHNPLSFSYRAMRGEYRIFIDPSADKSAYMICDLREKGHILFNHYERPAAHRAQFEIFFKSNLHTFLARLPPERNTRRSMGYYSTYLYNRFADIAQAMEIHSKLFRDDWWQALEYLNRYRFYHALSDPTLTIEEAQGILRQLEYKQFEGREPEELTYPREGWPLGLDWISYMSLLAGDLAQSLNNLGGGGSGSSHAKSASSGKISSSDINSYNQTLEAESRIKDTWETRNTVMDRMDGDDEDGETYQFGHGRTEAITDGKSYHRLSVAQNLHDLVHILQERSLVLNKSRPRTDLLYHGNRNKYNTEVLIPKRYRSETYTPGNLCVLLDVSGSVPVGLVRQVVGAIADAQGILHRGTGRLVAWSDKLCADIPLNKLEGVQTGGGTVLAAGIHYCKQYLDENASFFIISDFQDDLNAWLDAARDIKARKTAIGYGKSGVSVESWFALIGSNGDYRKRPVDLRSFIALFDTVLIRDY